MKKRLTDAYQQMTMPPSCAGQIEALLLEGQKRKKAGLYFRRMPAGSGGRPVAVAACLVVCLLLGCWLLIREDGRVRVAEPTTAAWEQETTGVPTTAPEETQTTEAPAETTQPTEETTPPTTEETQPPVIVVPQPAPPAPTAPPETTEPTDGGNGILGNPEGHIHTFLDIEIVGEYTCEAGGSKIMTCECGYVERYDIAPNSPHEYESLNPIPGGGATCTRPAVVYKICLRCQKVTTGEDPVNYPALGHDYRVTVVEPTETEQGYTEYSCKRCQVVTRDNYVDPIPSATEGTETAPTETVEETTEAPTE